MSNFVWKVVEVILLILANCEITFDSPERSYF